MNLKLTKKQQGEYAVAILSATTKEAAIEAHRQFGQMDTAKTTFHEQHAEAIAEIIKHGLASLRTKGNLSL